MSSTRQYFVDESGDGTLFNRRGRVVVGNTGCSSFFILGLLDVSDPIQLNESLAELRSVLLRDPYLSSIPSMQAKSRKTAIAFHAKDDCSEVRREVFRLLIQQELKFFAIVRDKNEIVRKIREYEPWNRKYKYHPNQLYDRCVSRLFRDRLHKGSSYCINFAMRGNKPRTECLEASLEQARTNFRRKYGSASIAPIEIIPTTPAASAGLQAVDYFLWALQRIYERGEERYWQYVSDKVSLVHDVDDNRIREYGEYYSRENLLTFEKITKRKPGI